MDIVWILFGISLIIFFLVLSLLLVYVIFVVRRVNILLQKVDYLVEDITYKAEALTPTIDLVNKISNYALSADLVINKSIKKTFATLKNNQASIMKLVNTILSKFSKGKNKNKMDEDFSDPDTDDININIDDYEDSDNFYSENINDDYDTSNSEEVVEKLEKEDKKAKKTNTNKKGGK